MTKTVIYFTPVVRHFNFSCRTVQIQKKNSRFTVGNSHPARQFILPKGTKKEPLSSLFYISLGPEGFEPTTKGL